MLTAKCYHELCFQLVVESKPLSDLLTIIALRFKVISILLLRIYDNSVRKHLHKTFDVRFLILPN